METQCQNLTTTQHNEFIKLLQIFGDSFNVTLGTWKKHPIDFNLKEDLKATCSRLYPLPKVHEEMFKREVDCLVLLGVLDKETDS